MDYLLNKCSAPDAERCMLTSTWDVVDIAAAAAVAITVLVLLLVIAIVVVLCVLGLILPLPLRLVHFVLCHFNTFFWFAM